jgi:hypothetical protein
VEGLLCLRKEFEEGIRGRKIIFKEGIRGRKVFVEINKVLEIVRY